MTEDEVARLILDGTLIPVQVFGTNNCCEHGPDAECEANGFGLCDRFSQHAPGGSDCNRAEHFLLRPSDAAMNTPSVRMALDQVLSEG